MTIPSLVQRAWRKLRRTLAPRPESLYPLRRPLPLPAGISRDALFSFLASVRPDGAAEAEMAAYCGEDFERFVLTWDLACDLVGDALELGGNPYFTTMLLRRFSPLRLTIANYFGPQITEPVIEQKIHHRDADGTPATVTLASHHFDIERDRFPFPAAAFDVVLFCEILEHLTADPWQTLLEIRRVLQPGATLIVTTPNVARLENVTRILAGENIYDPYSAYGPSGRHNREYTLAELRRLVEHAGFEVQTAFTADVRANRANVHALPTHYQPLLARRDDLGQYLFLKATRGDGVNTRRPGWLFRSYPPAELG